MKQLFKLAIIFCIAAQTTQAQNVGIGTNSPAATLDVISTNSGILIPRIALSGNNDTDLDNVGGPETHGVSELIYNTATVGGANAVTPGYYYWTGTIWERLLIDADQTDDHDWYDQANIGNSPDDITDNVYTMGNVGIGTTAAPAEALEVVGNIQNTEAYIGEYFTFGGAGFGHKDFKGTFSLGYTQTSDGTVRINSADGADIIFTQGPSIRALMDGTTDNWIFSNTTIADATPVSVFNIKGNLSLGSAYAESNTVAPANGAMIEGDVAIGRTNPSSRLHITDASLDPTGGLTITQGGNNSEIYHNSANDLIFRKRSNTNQLVLDSGGNIGIGIDAPQSKLDIEGNLAVGATYSGTSAAPANGAIIQGSVGIGTTSPQSKLDVEGNLAVGATYSGTSAAPTNGAIIQGSVGIGTTAPTYKLEVDAGASGNYLRLTGNKDNASTHDGEFTIGNTTGSNDVFRPVINGVSDNAAGNDTGPGLFFIAQSSGTTGTGSVMRFEARVKDAAASTQYASRRPFEWRNGSSTTVMLIEPDGDLVVDQGNDVIKMSNNAWIAEKPHIPAGGNQSNTSYQGSPAQGISTGNIRVAQGDRVLVVGQAFIKIDNYILGFRLKVFRSNCGGDNVFETPIMEVDHHGSGKHFVVPFNFIDELRDDGGCNVTGDGTKNISYRIETYTTDASRVYDIEYANIQAVVL